MADTPHGSKVEFEIKFIRDGVEEQHTKVVLENEWKVFGSLLTEPANCTVISKNGDVAQNELSINVPGTKEPSTKSTECSFTIKAFGADSSLKTSAIANHIATMRRRIMVNQYCPFPNENEDVPVLGIALAGYAKETPDDSDERLYQFANFEPPQHNNWVYKDTITSRYKQGGIKAQEAIKKGLLENIKRLMNASPDTEGKPASVIAKMFRFGPAGQKKVERKITSNITNTMLPSKNGWKLEIKLKNSSTNGSMK